MESIFKFRNDMNNIREQIYDTFPKNDSDEDAFEDVFVPYTNNIVPLWQTDFERAQINFSYSPFASMYYIIREWPEEFYTMANGHMVRSESDYEEKRKEFNNLYMQIVHGGGNGVKDGVCSQEEMIRLGSLFYVVLQAADTSQGLSIDEQKRFKADWCKDSKDVVFDWDEIKEKSDKLQDIYLSDTHWHKTFYQYITNTNEDTFWFIKLPDFLSQSYIDKKAEAEDFDWIDHPSFMTLTGFLDKINKQDGYISIYYRSTDKFRDKLKETLGLRENLSGVLQNSHTYLFQDVLDDDYEIVSNYDVTKPVKWEESYNAK
jgi:hypothetical protein